MIWDGRLGRYQWWEDDVLIGRTASEEGAQRAPRRNVSRNLNVRKAKLCGWSMDHVVYHNYAAHNEYRRYSNNLVRRLISHEALLLQRGGGFTGRWILLATR